MAGAVVGVEWAGAVREVPVRRGDRVQDVEARAAKAFGLRPGVVAVHPVDGTELDVATLPDRPRPLRACVADAALLDLEQRRGEISGLQWEAVREQLQALRLELSATKSDLAALQHAHERATGALRDETQGVRAQLGKVEAQVQATATKASEEVRALSAASRADVQSLEQQLKRLLEQRQELLQSSVQQETQQRHTWQAQFAAELRRGLGASQDAMQGLLKEQQDQAAALEAATKGVETDLSQFKEAVHADRALRDSWQKQHARELQGVRADLEALEQLTADGRQEVDTSVEALRSAMENKVTTLMASNAAQVYAQCSRLRADADAQHAQTAERLRGQQAEHERLGERCQEQHAALLARLDAAARELAGRCDELGQGVEASSRGWRDALAGLDATLGRVKASADEERHQRLAATTALAQDMAALSSRLSGDCVELKQSAQQASAELLKLASGLEDQRGRQQQDAERLREQLAQEATLRATASAEQRAWVQLGLKKSEEQEAKERAVLAGQLQAARQQLQDLDQAHQAGDASRRAFEEATTATLDKSQGELASLTHTGERLSAAVRGLCAAQETHATQLGSVNDLLASQQALRLEAAAAAEEQAARVAGRLLEVEKHAEQVKHFLPVVFAKPEAFG